MKKKKQILSVAGVLLFACALFFLARGNADPERATDSEPDFFAYTDTQNRLYVWREGRDEPLLLTDHAFALEGEDAEVPYWEAWEYWEEWDETKGDWIQNEEKALQDVVWELPDGRLLFPENMRWTVFGMQSGAKEREEFLTYSSEDELEDWIKVRIFCYDLCLQASDAEEETERIAENVLYYSVDQTGAVWYCQAVGDQRVQVRGEELSSARCVLYRYDGTDHQRIGEIDGRKKEPYRVEKGGDWVIFYGMDDSLYRCRPKEEPKLLAEGADAVLRRDDDQGSLLYVRDGSVYRAENGKEEKELYAGEEDRQSVGVLGREGEVLFILEAKADVRYADWIAKEDGTQDSDTEALWELLEEMEMDYEPRLCTVRVVDCSVSPAKTIDEVKGYVLMAPLADEEGDVREVYYMEMMPADSFEKIPLSELLGSSLPEDVLYTYAYYLDNYGTDNKERVFAWALEACWEQEAFKKRSSVYGVTRTGIYALDQLGEGLILGASQDYSSDVTQLYLRQYQSPDMERDYRRYGHHLYYGYLENRYVLDGGGNCRKVVELADETAVIGDEVFYSRNMGLEGYVNLYGTDHEELLASAADISLESLQKSGDLDAYLFLAEGLRTDEEEHIPVHAGADLRAAYKELGIERERFSDEKDLHTLMLWQEGTVRELERDIYQYAFYGEGSVWMLQYKEPAASDTEEHGRIGSLFIWENEEMKKITDQAVWMAGAGSEEGSRSASWVFE